MSSLHLSRARASAPLTATLRSFWQDVQLPTSVITGGDEDTYFRTFAAEQVAWGLATLLGLEQSQISSACVHPHGEPCVPASLMRTTSGFDYDPQRRRSEPDGDNITAQYMRDSSGSVVAEFRIHPPHNVSDSATNETLRDENNAFLDGVVQTLQSASTSPPSDSASTASSVLEAQFDAVQLTVGDVSFIASYGENADGDVQAVQLSGTSSDSDDGLSPAAIGAIVAVCCALLLAAVISLNAKKHKVNKVASLHDAMPRASDGSNQPPSPNELPALRMAVRYRDSIIEQEALDIPAHVRVQQALRAHAIGQNRIGAGISQERAAGSAALEARVKEIKAQRAQSAGKTRRISRVDTWAVRPSIASAEHTPRGVAVDPSPGGVLDGDSEDGIVAPLSAWVVPGSRRRSSMV